MKLSELKVNEKNPFPAEDISALVEKIEKYPKFLELRPIVYDPATMVILGGNKRYAALKQLGHKEIPDEWVKSADQLTEQEKRAFIFADNYNIGTWDFEVIDDDEAIEWDIEMIEEEIELDASEDGYEMPDEIKTDIVLGDLFEIGEHRLLCGDSTNSDDVEKLMNGKKADMVFTDPPYNIDYQGVKDKRDKIANDKMSDEDFTQFLYDALNVNSDTFYVCCSWQCSHLFRDALERLQKPVKSFIVWNKVNPAQHLDKYFKQHEIILYHGKFGGEKTVRGDVWEVKRERNTVHPTMKPISLIELALNDNHQKKNIYDAFGGSGSTMVASHQLKKNAYLMELEPKYCQVIVDRMMKLDKSLTLKKNGKDITREYWESASLQTA